MLSKKKRKNYKYKAVIIGAGRIGANFDSPKSVKIMTHAHAYFNHPKIELAGFLDIDKKAVLRAAKKWGSKPYHKMDKIMKDIRPDIVSICVPDSEHFKLLLEVAKYKPKLIICEKPVTADIKKTRKIIKLYKKIGIPVLVNYSRRFDKLAQKIQKEIKEEKYGKVLCASGIYTKGIMHNGSHMIDFARYFFGEIKKSSVLYSVNDYGKKDKSVAGFLEFDKCKQFYLMAGDDRQYFIFELDIILEKGRLRFFDSDQYLSIQKVINDPLYPRCRCLDKPIIKKTMTNNALISLINNAVEHLEKNKPLICDINNARQTEKVCFSLLKK